MSSRAFFGFDILKFLLCFLVIKIHVGTLIYYGNVAVNYLAEIAVPSFFIISGFLFNLKYQNLAEEISSLSIWKQIYIYTKKFMHLYCIWTIIYLPLSIYHQIELEHPLWLAILSILRNVCFYGQNWMSWSLWFLYSLIISYSYILLLKKGNICNKTIMIIGFICGIFDYYLASVISLPFQRVFLTGFSYTSLGFFLPNIINRYKFHYSIILLTVSLLLESCNHFLSAYLLSLSIVMFFADLNLQKRAIFVWLRKMSTLIYLIHLIGLSVVGLIFEQKSSFAILYFCTTLLSCFLSFFIIWLSKYEWARVLRLLY